MGRADGPLGTELQRDYLGATYRQVDSLRLHKIGNILAALPKSAHKDAKAALAEIYNAEDRDHAEQPRRRSPRPTARSGPKRSRRSPTLDAAPIDRATNENQEVPIRVGSCISSRP